MLKEHIIISIHKTTLNSRDFSARKPRLSGFLIPRLTNTPNHPFPHPVQKAKSMNIFRKFSFLALILAFALTAAHTFLTRGLADTKAPVIEVPEENLKISIKDSDEVLLKGITATDDRDGDITDKIFVEQLGPFGENQSRTLTLAVVDNAGNVAKSERTITYTDYQAPRFKLEEPLIFSMAYDIDVEKNLTASDLLDGDITARIRESSKYQLPYQAGDYPLEFTVTNSAGDTSAFQATITLIDYNKALDNSGIGLSIYLIYLKKGQDFDPKDYLESITLGNYEYIREEDDDEPFFKYDDEARSLPSDNPDEIECSDLTITNPVNTQKPGCYEAIYEYHHKDNDLKVRLVVIVED